MIDYESPVFVSIVLYTIYVLLGGAIVLTIWSALNSLRLRGRTEAREHGIPARRIALGSAVLLVLTMAVTWLLGSTKPIVVNGETYDNAFWLRTSDMFIGTAAVLLVVLVGIMVTVTIMNVIRKKKSQSHV